MNESRERRSHEATDANSSSPLPSLTPTTGSGRTKSKPNSLQARSATSKASTNTPAGQSPFSAPAHLEHQSETISPTEGWASSSPYPVNGRPETSSLPDDVRAEQRAQKARRNRADSIESMELKLAAMNSMKDNPAMLDDRSSAEPRWNDKTIKAAHDALARERGENETAEDFAKRRAAWMCSEKELCDMRVNKDRQYAEELMVHQAIENADELLARALEVEDRASEERQLTARKAIVDAEAMEAAAAVKRAEAETRRALLNEYLKQEEINPAQRKARLTSIVSSPMSISTTRSRKTDSGSHVSIRPLLASTKSAATSKNTKDQGIDWNAAGKLIDARSAPSGGSSVGFPPTPVRDKYGNKVAVANSTPQSDSPVIKDEKSQSCANSKTTTTSKNAKTSEYKHKSTTQLTHKPGEIPDSTSKGINMGPTPQGAAGKSQRVGGSPPSADGGDLSHPSDSSSSTHTHEEHHHREQSDSNSSDQSSKSDSDDQTSSDSETDSAGERATLPEYNSDNDDTDSAWEQNPSHRMAEITSNLESGCTGSSRSLGKNRYAAFAADEDPSDNEDTSDESSGKPSSKRSKRSKKTHNRKPKPEPVSHDGKRSIKYERSGKRHQPSTKASRKLTKEEGHQCTDGGREPTAGQGAGAARDVGDSASKGRTPQKDANESDRDHKRRTKRNRRRKHHASPKRERFTVKPGDPVAAGVSIKQLKKWRASIHAPIVEFIIKFWENRAKRIPAPEKYNGSKDLITYEAHLTGMFRWLSILGYAGPEHDQTRLDIHMFYFTGPAKVWVENNVNGMGNKKKWTHLQVIMAIYEQFIDTTAVQEATATFWSTKYSPELGPGYFYNELFRAANRMVKRPDSYTFKNQFIARLPEDMADELVDRNITAEYSSMNQVLEGTLSIELLAAPKSKEDPKKEWRGVRERLQAVEEAPEGEEEAPRLQAGAVKREELVNRRMYRFVKRGSNDTRPGGRAGGGEASKPTPANIKCYKYGGPHYMRDCKQPDANPRMNCGHETASVAGSSKSGVNRTFPASMWETKDDGEGLPSFLYDDDENLPALHQCDDSSDDESEYEWTHLCVEESENEKMHQPRHQVLVETITDPLDAQYDVAPPLQFNRVPPGPHLFQLCDEWPVEERLSDSDIDTFAREMADHILWQQNTTEVEEFLFATGERTLLSEKPGKRPERREVFLKKSSVPLPRPPRTKDENFLLKDVPVAADILVEHSFALKQVNLILQCYCKASHPHLIPITPKLQHFCLTAYMDIMGKPAFALFDSGCTTEAVSPDFAKVAGIKVFPIKSAITLQLGTAGSRSKINHGTTVPVKYDHLLSEEYMDIVNLDRFDAIIGTKYM
ncbi:hypothetical protein C8R43DRAFT_951854 [Mycena crocata]|nr:hypothetical protein C8R43DRAFT_951854 [Mycena crocata]